MSILEIMERKKAKKSYSNHIKTSTDALAFQKNSISEIKDTPGYEMIVNYWKIQFKASMSILEKVDINDYKTIGEARSRFIIAKQFLEFLEANET